MSTTSETEYDLTEYGITDEIPPVEETKPRIPKPTFFESMQQGKERLAKVREKLPAGRTRAKSVKRAQPRVSVEKLISTGWDMIGRLLYPVNPPVAKTLSLQAPVAGMVLEDYVRNTVVDKVLQPLARMEEKGSVFFSLLGPPALVAVLTAKPEMAPVIIPMLRAALESWLTLAGPKMELLKERNEKFAEQYGAEIDVMLNIILSSMGPNMGQPDANGE